ncbi:hypothetical protein C8A00DRAFT_43123 [Chaetomidium leptoderma]|uniref:F-box domain-containing protein n=1 Tax=Chaetomidium leptoderma TaxID=669021 RepID=A0AAN6ZXS0_9PEZI|nr:hypothetical protein C8A00DRAFT_43123 [Chaetomidium leptoderma]
MAGPPDPQTPPSPPLLQLTPHIRRRIYRYVGLAPCPGDDRPYTFNLQGGRALRDAPDPSCFHGLLLSCRDIHAEAATLLYSANRFVLYYSHGDPTSLRPLRALTATSLRSLSNLKIILNQASCHQRITYEYEQNCCIHDRGNDSFYRCEQTHGGLHGLHQLPLLSPASDGSDGDKLSAVQTTLSEWHSAAARLSLVAPGNLALSLVCDIDLQHPQALDVAKSAVAPIRLLPPSHLRECHIRLAKTADSQLQEVARDTVLQACGIATVPSKPSNTVTLTTLPRELRIRILEYTDLVTPAKEVTWSRHDPIGYSIFARVCVEDSTPSAYHSAQFFACWFGYSLIGGPPTNGCFCRSRHAAFSLTCKCWAPPGPLFLICRTFNRFIVHDFSWRLEPVPTYPYPHERLAASEFLREVVPTRSLAYLRFLDWPGTQHPAMQDWRTTVDWLRAKLNPPALTLRLIVAHTTDDTPDVYYSTITTEEGGKIMRAYIDLLQPLRQLVKDDGLGGWVYREKIALKERAERHVMGARYESLYANEREEPKRSEWDELFYD